MLSCNRLKSLIFNLNNKRYIAFLTTSFIFSVIGIVYSFLKMVSESYLLPYNIDYLKAEVSFYILIILAFFLIASISFLVKNKFSKIFSFTIISAICASLLLVQFIPDYPENFTFKIFESQKDASLLVIPRIHKPLVNNSNEIIVQFCIANDITPTERGTCPGKAIHRETITNIESYLINTVDTEFEQKMNTKILSWVRKEN